MKIVYIKACHAQRKLGSETGKYGLVKHTILLNLKSHTESHDTIVGQLL